MMPLAAGFVVVGFPDDPASIVLTSRRTAQAFGVDVDVLAADLRRMVEGGKGLPHGDPWTFVRAGAHGPELGLLCAGLDLCDGTAQLQGVVVGVLRDQVAVAGRALLELRRLLRDSTSRGWLQ